MCFGGQGANNDVYNDVWTLEILQAYEYSASAIGRWRRVVLPDSITPGPRFAASFLAAGLSTATPARFESFLLVGGASVPIQSRSASSESSSPAAAARNDVWMLSLSHAAACASVGVLLWSLWLW